MQFSVFKCVACASEHRPLARFVFIKDFLELLVVYVGRYLEGRFVFIDFPSARERVEVWNVQFFTDLKELDSWKCSLQQEFSFQQLVVKSHLVPP